MKISFLVLVIRLSSKVVFAAAFLLWISNPAVSIAQENPSEFWSGLKYSVELNKDWKVSLEEEFRFQEGNSLDRHLTQLEIQFKKIKNLDISFAMRHSGEFDREGGRQGYREYLRYQVDVDHQYEPQRFTIKNRARYQVLYQVENPEFRDEENQTTLRWKTSVEYNIRDWKWDPEIVAEIFYRLENPQQESGINRYRVGIQSEYGFGNSEIGIGYLRENGLGTDLGEFNNILQLQYEYKFSLKKKKK